MLEPVNISPDAHVIDDLMVLATKLTGVAFILVVVALAYFLVCYRARAGHKALYTHGTSRGALVLTLVLSAVVFVGLDVVLAIEDHHAYNLLYGETPTDEESSVVHVFAKQFEWNFRYPGVDGQFGTEDDFFTVGDLTVPKGATAKLYLRSYDVIHSFFLPNLRTKQDILPGKTVGLWFKTNRSTDEHARSIGDPAFNFEIACAELCGAQHSKMRGTLRVLEQKEYDAWVKTKSAVAPLSEVPPIWELWPADDPDVKYGSLDGEEKDEDEDEE